MLQLFRPSPRLASAPASPCEALQIAPSMPYPTTMLAPRHLTRHFFAPLAAGLCAASNAAAFAAPQSPFGPANQVDTSGDVLGQGIGGVGDACLRSLAVAGLRAGTAVAGLRRRELPIVGPRLRCSPPGTLRPNPQRRQEQYW